MDINSLFPSKYVKAADLQGHDVDLTMRAIAVEDVAGDGSEAEYRPIVYFDGFTKGLLLNRTNARTIAALYGPETDNWLGESITLYPTETSYRGAMVACIRVRSNRPANGNGQHLQAQPVVLPRETIQRSRQPATVANGNGDGATAVRF